MSPSHHILLIRAGYAQRKKIDHPLHHPPPLPLKYAQALLEQNSHFKTRIVDGLIEPMPDQAVLAMIEQWPVHTVCVEIASPSSEKGLTLCKSIREKHADIFIVAVGSDVSERHLFYANTTGLFDVILKGEFELELSRLMARVQERGKADVIPLYGISALNQEGCLVPDPGALPILEWTRRDLKKYPYRYPLRLPKKIRPGYVASSRGCRHGCSFCSPSVRKSYGKKLRMRPAGHILQEIENLQRLGVNIIVFEDDDFTGDPEHVRSLCAEIRRKKLNIHWTCHARIDEVTAELLRDMKEAGCVLILFGVESGSAKIIRLLHKSSRERDWNSLARETFRQARAIGIATCALFMVGNPQETRADVDESIKLAFELQPDFIKVHNFTLYPGSQDYKRYGAIPDLSAAPHHYLRPLVNVSRLTDQELKILQKEFYRSFFFRPGYLWPHIKNYSLFYLFNWTWSFRMISELLCFLLSRGRQGAGGVPSTT
ncbi:MAG TPA: radical SAM protein [Candidatus Omnitrophota bacterium]|nr:radical SAM protein [Candidatus Omnitrophota bacterium]HQO57548.1 radical SAM protein [Candidatus Omnitrophota bacterium]